MIGTMNIEFIGENISHSPKLHPYIKLKNEYEHLQKRTWDLFKCGKMREYKLETAVVNAWKQFGEIIETEDTAKIKTIAVTMRELMAKTMDELNT